MLEQKKTRLANLFNTENKTYYYTLLKAIGIGFFASIVFLITIGVSGAWFFSGNITEKTINVGSVDISLPLVNNYFTYTGQTTQSINVDVTNDSNTHVVVRAVLGLRWLDDYEMGDVSFTLANNNWTMGTDGYYYYDLVVNPSGDIGSEAQLIDSVELSNMDDKKLGRNFIVDIYVEGAQYANSGYANLWITAPASWLSLVQ
jgi:hypothetical protein